MEIPGISFNEKTGYRSENWVINARNKNKGVATEIEYWGIK